MTGFKETASVAKMTLPNPSSPEAVHDPLYRFGPPEPRRLPPQAPARPTRTPLRPTPARRLGPPHLSRLRPRLPPPRLDPRRHLVDLPHPGLRPRPLLPPGRRPPAGLARRFRPGP